MRKIVFDSPVGFSPDGALLFGLSAKDSDNPIGMFGTGLKYTIAVLLRNTQELKIECLAAGKVFETYEFVTREGNFRGSPYLEVHLRDQAGHLRSLGFTTELGLNWDLQDVFRELWSNAKDEGGHCYEKKGRWDTRFKELPETNRMIVTGNQFAAAYDARWEFIIEDPISMEAIHRSSFLDIAKDYPAKGIFYRGISVIPKSNRKTYLGTYNFHGSMTLTEDRTMKYWHEAAFDIGCEVIKVQDYAWCKRWLKEAPGHTEGNVPIHFSTNTGGYSKEFLDACHDLYKNDGGPYHSSVRDIVLNHIFNGNWPTDPLKLSDPRKRMLERAIEICTEMGYPVGDTPILNVMKLTDSRKVLGAFKEGKIFLSEKAYQLGQFQLTATLLEELVHRDEGHMDETYSMQNFLFEKWLATHAEMKKLVL